MFGTAGIVTTRSAADVGSMLRYLFEHPEDERHFALELSRHQPTGADDWTEYVRLLEEPRDRVIVLANGQELVRCHTKDGRKIDLLFGAIADREFDPVIAFVEGYEP